ncbi:hypothetical protein TgHK011_008623 [Trichoderma gracile]|nr:hypothetical protein TgHK011_008623 [Trichoderma gracile]
MPDNQGASLRFRTVTLDSVRISSNQLANFIAIGHPNAATVSHADRLILDEFIQRHRPETTNAFDYPVSWAEAPRSFNAFLRHWRTRALQLLPDFQLPDATTEGATDAQQQTEESERPVTSLTLRLSETRIIDTPLQLPNPVQASTQNPPAPAQTLLAPTLAFQDPADIPQPLAADNQDDADAPARTTSSQETPALEPVPTPQQNEGPVTTDTTPLPTQNPAPSSLEALVDNPALSSPQQSSSPFIPNTPTPVIPGHWPPPRSSSSDHGLLSDSEQDMADQHSTGEDPLLTTTLKKLQAITALTLTLQPR